MSKELEALEWFGNNAKIHYAFGDIAVDNFKILHQALKRNEPMKVMHGDINYCPNCGERLFDGVEQNYCDVCGQKLDWSDEK